MGNPKPKLENLKPFSPIGSEALADKQIQVRLPKDVDEAVRSLPDKTDWLRRVIVEAAKRELMGN